jgi:hypothetical protein
MEKELRMTTQYEYECALTGVVQQGGHEDQSDKLGDLPVGWTRIQMTRRQYNPKWVLIQQVKDAMVEGLMAQFPAEARGVQLYAVTIQVEAQFHSLEKDTPMYMPDVDDVVYISDSGEIADNVNEVREMLGLSELPEEGEEEEEEEEEEDEEDEELLLSHDGEVGDSEPAQPGAK